MHTVEVLTTIEDVPAAEWDALATANPYAGHRWHRLAEAVMADYRPRYLLLRREGRLVAAAMGALESRLQNPALDARFGRLVRRSPFLLVTVPMTATAGLLVADGPDAQTDLQALLRELRALTRRERFRFCIIDHLPLRHPAVTAQRGYCRLAWLPDTALDLRWASFEEYLRDLPRKKRKEITRTQRRCERDGIVIKPVVATPEESRTLDRLVAELVRKHGGSRRFVPDLFVKAAAMLGADLTVLGAHRDGALVGCLALVRSGEQLDARWIGRDYDRTTDTAVYASLVTAAVQHAITAGVRRLHFGAAAYETKKHYGVAVEPRTRLFAARNPAATWLVSKLAHRFEPPGMPLEDTP